MGLSNFCLQFKFLFMYVQLGEGSVLSGKGCKSVPIVQLQLVRNCLSPLECSCALQIVPSTSVLRRNCHKVHV